MKHLTKIFTCAVAGLLSLSTLSAQKRIVEHRVKDNETVYSIAQTYRTSIEKVFELNPWAKGSIKPGDKLIIYTGADYKKEAPTTTARKPPAIQALPQLLYPLSKRNLNRIKKAIGIELKQVKPYTALLATMELARKPLYLRTQG